MARISGGHLIQSVQGGHGRRSIRIPLLLQEESLAKELEDLMGFLGNSLTEQITSIYLYPQPVDKRGNPLAGAIFTPYVVIPFRIETGKGDRRKILLRWE